MGKINLRGKLENIYPERTPQDVLFDELKLKLSSGVCYERIVKPRGWGKTSLALRLLNEIDGSILICNSPKEEIRIRKESDITTYKKYYIYGYIETKNFLGLSPRAWIVDGLDQRKWEELLYFLGFRMNNYVRFV